MDGSDSVLRGHVVACALPFWGHTKSLCVILSKLVQLRPMYATLFTEVSVLDKVENELRMQFPSESQRSLKERIRVVVLPSPESPFRLDGFQTYFLDAYKTLYDGGASHIVYNTVPPPRLVILDFFFYKALNGVHAISGSSVPVYAWQTGAVAALVYLFGPESMGGNGDIAEKISKITGIDTETQNKEIEEIYNHTDGRLVEIRGIPPMYDYEHVPQIPALPVEPIEVIFMSQYGNRFLSECDGIISTSSRLFETGPIEQWQEYLNPQPVLAVGPLSDPENVKLDISRHWDVVAFLDGALEKFGPYSVVYISFGSVLWPSEPDKLWTVVDVLVQEENPFILSHASPVASILDSMMEKIKAFGFGFAAKWVPQQLILQHEACGWFLTYGINKRWCTIVNTQNFRFIAAYPEESSSNRICWPFSVDQPVNAANVSTVHNIGYELLEVRNGHGLRPLHRLGNKRPEGTVDAVKREILDVLYMARGEDGKAKRMRAQSFKYKLSKDTTQGGRAYTDLDRLAQIIV